MELTAELALIAAGSGFIGGIGFLVAVLIGCHIIDWLERR